MSRPSPLAAWWLAIRPKTLSISVVPVVVGTSLAWAEASSVAWWPMIMAALAAICIQVGTNLHNDVRDFERGADSADRLGPGRATASGWLTAEQVYRGVIASFGLAMAFGVYLAWRGGWPIVVLGLCSVAAGLAYTGGPRPVAYSALGELFVWLFFGLAAVMGSYYLQVFRISWGSFIAAAMIGFFAAAVIVVNNYRDLDSDRRIGKNTLAVRLGRKGTQAEYAALLVVPYLLLAPLAATTGSLWAALLPALTLPWAALLLRRFRREPPGPGFNRTLAQTAQLQLVFGLLLSMGLIV
jgi:1,4-dihydroxy-2-naphthoate octaprenyltransferase